MSIMQVKKTEANDFWMGAVLELKKSSAVTGWIATMVLNSVNIFPYFHYLLSNKL